MQSHIFLRSNLRMQIPKLSRIKQVRWKSKKNKLDKEANKTFSVTNDKSFAESPLFEQWVQFEPSDPEPKPPDKIEEMVEVVYEDENFLFLNKPANMAVHAEEGIRETFQQRVEYYWRTRYPHSRFTPDLLHRIDKVSSGIIVYGKNLRMEQHYRHLQDDETYVSECGIKKGYIAVCMGRPPKDEGLVEGKIARLPKNRNRFWITNHIGKPVQTQFKFITEVEHPVFGSLSVMLFTMHKSRRHQIRSTAASLGCPILGDVKYGGDEFKIPMLHSAFQGFEGLPGTGRTYSVSYMPPWNSVLDVWTTKAQYWTKEALMTLNENPIPVKKAPARRLLSRRTRMRLVKNEEEELFKPPQH